MIATHFPARGTLGASRTTWLALAAFILTAGLARGQASDGPSPSAALTDPGIQQAGCSSCGGGASGALGCDTCVGPGCDGPRCVPGRTECCDTCEACSLFGRIWCGLSAMCCPDPCYQPCYIPAADAAFFQDSARPVSRTMIGWDNGRHGTTPDRAEFFWSRIGGRGPARRESDINDYNVITQYNEFATGRFSLFTNMPYRSLDPTNNPHAAGFGNLTIGTKSMMVDSEILLLTTQFKTIIPTANPGKGIDNGHVTLEPSLLVTLKVMPDTYLQTQIAEWIPIAGDPNFAGAVLHYHFSLNHVFIKPSNNFQFIGNLEFSGYSFQDGLFTPFAATAPTAAPPPIRADRYTYISIGPGFRMVFCQKFDVGFGMAFSTSSNNFAQQLYRTEVRWRF